METGTGPRKTRRGRTFSRRGRRDDWILCQVTSNPYGDSRAVHLRALSFDSGLLRADSYARPGKLFTASSDLMVAQVAILNTEARAQIVDAVTSILRA